jgi:hypothetical protein
MCRWLKGFLGIGGLPVLNFYYALIERRPLENTVADLSF